MGVKMSASQFLKLTSASANSKVCGFVDGNVVMMTTPYGSLSGEGTGGEQGTYDFVAAHISELIDDAPSIKPDEQADVVINRDDITTTIGGVLCSFPTLHTEGAVIKRPQPLDSDQFNLPDSFVRYYRFSSAFCGQDGRYDFSKVACAENEICASNSCAYVYFPVDFEKPLARFENLLGLERSPSLLRYLLPAGLPLDVEPVTLQFCKEGEQLYTSLKQGAITHYVKMDQGTIPSAKNLRDKPRELAFTLLQAEAQAIRETIEKYVIKEDVVYLVNNDGYLGFAVQALGNCSVVSTDIAVNLPNKQIFCFDSGSLITLLKMGGVQLFYRGKDVWLVKSSPMNVLIRAVENSDVELRFDGGQKLNIRKNRVGDLLLDGAEAISASNATILSKF